MTFALIAIIELSKYVYDNWIIFSCCNAFFFLVCSIAQIRYSTLVLKSFMYYTWEGTRNKLISNLGYNETRILTNSRCYV